MKGEQHTGCSPFLVPGVQARSKDTFWGVRYFADTILSVELNAQMMDFLISQLTMALGL